MKQKANPLGLLGSILLIAACAILSANAGNGKSNGNGPTNSWGEWRYKKFAVGFTNSLLITLNGHNLPQFAPELFDEETHVYLFGAEDGEVYGAGDMTVASEDAYAVLNVEAIGALSTKGTTPNLAFELLGEGSGTVGGVEREASLKAKFVQTEFIVSAPGGGIPETYHAEGVISGTVKLAGQKPIQFEDTVRIPLDNVPGHWGDAAVRPQLMLDLVQINEQKFAGHAHGTNNLFGRYEGAKDDVLANGTYKAKTGNLSMDVRGLGPTASAIKCTVTAVLESAPPGATIHVNNVELKGRAYGQKPNWNGNGIVYPTEP